MRLDTEKHSRAYLRDTLVKLQAMQKCDNKALQICLQEPLLLHFYTAPAVHEDEAKRNPNGAWLEGIYERYITDPGRIREKITAR